MLYVYNLFEYFGDEAVKAGNLQGLKSFGLEDMYIADTDKIVIEGINPRISPLHEFISKGHFSCGDVLELNIDLLNKRLEIPKDVAIEMLSDDLRTDDGSKYRDRIFNSENPAEETEKIIRELTTVVVGVVIDNLNDEYERVKENKFQWM